MKLDLSQLSYDPQWFPFDDGVELHIRPYPFSRSNVVLRDNGFLISGKDQCEIFKHCLVAWKNVVGADNNPLPCTDEVKQKIFDFRMGGISDFVLQKNREFQDRKGGEEKN